VAGNGSEDETSLGGNIYLQCGYNSAVGINEAVGSIYLSGSAVNVKDKLNVNHPSSTAILSTKSSTQSGLVFSVNTSGSTAGLSDITQNVYQTSVLTTDATSTALISYAIPANTTVMMEVYVVARRTGGVSGSADDGAGYIRRCLYKNASGTATLVGSVNNSMVAESQSGWELVDPPSISSNTVTFQVKGAIGNNVTWHATLNVYQVST
jgi:hypothetical protein